MIKSTVPKRHNISLDGGVLLVSAGGVLTSAAMESLGDAVASIPHAALVIDYAKGTSAAPPISVVRHMRARPRIPMGIVVPPALVQAATAEAMQMALLEGSVRRVFLQPRDAHPWALRQLVVSEMQQEWRRAQG
jgi:hypothetical protein